MAWDGHAELWKQLLVFGRHTSVPSQTVISPYGTGREQSSAALKEDKKTKKRRSEVVPGAGGTELDGHEAKAPGSAKKKKDKLAAGSTARTEVGGSAAGASLAQPSAKKSSAKPPSGALADTEGNESDGDDAMAFVKPAKKGGAAPLDKDERTQAAARTGASARGAE